MSDAISIAEISMNNDLLKMQVLSNNLANVNTVAYKRDLVNVDAFLQALNSNIHAPIPITKISTDFSMGTLNATNNALDVAIEDKGFFEVTTDRGVFFTRQGNFQTDESGRLVTHDGFVVNGEGGEIRLVEGNPEIDAEGNINDESGFVGRLKIVGIEDTDNLKKIGAGLYEYIGNGIIEQSNVATVKQGFLEVHNVDIPSEMVNMIELVNHFRSNQRVVQGYDDILSEAISVIGNF